MKKINTLIVILFLLSNSNAQTSINLEEKIPFDESVVHGQLENGLQYYIKENKKPEKRAELRLIINAGSILEDDNQKGLAHFVEHMAFNGTKNFPKEKLIDYLESIGLRFGPDLNASTSFDETIYRLEVRTDSIHQFEKAFLVLGDWAQNISFDDEEIDKERGVIVEEWRLRRGAGARIMDKQFPVLFKNSLYAERMPIGDKNIIENADYNTIKKFYKDWYRPGLMAVIAVGDFDKHHVEKLIHENFSAINFEGEPGKRIIAEVPDHAEILVSIATDKEATYSTVSIYYKKPPKSIINIEDYRNNLIENLAHTMFNERLYELTRQPDPPFLGAFSNKYNIVRSKSAYVLGTYVADNGIQQGLRSIITEAARIEKYGFTETEFERAKKKMHRSIEKFFNERDKIESSNLVGQLADHFLKENSVPSPETQYNLWNDLMPGMTLEEVNSIVKNLITNNNRVVLVSLPEKEEIINPTEEEILSIIDKARMITVEPYIDRALDEDLISSTPAPGKVVGEKFLDQVGVTELTLSNNVKIVLKPTDFKNDEILFSAFSFGGTSLVPDSNFTAASTAASILSQSGIRKFDQVELGKKLSDKIVRVSPWVSELQEGLYGSTTPKDVETLFQLIYLSFTSPRKDSTAYNTFLKQAENFLRNRNASPSTAFSDTIMVTLSNYHPRSKPPSLETMKELSLEKSFEFYKDRFADASDFTFIFIGNFSAEEIKPLVTTYIGSLPDLNRVELWHDVGKRYPGGVIKKEIFKGIEPKSNVSINFTGDFTWTTQSVYEMRSLCEVLSIKLREVLREDQGATYGVSVNNFPSRWPKEDYRIMINFGCAPENAEEMIQSVFTQLDSLKQFGIHPEYINKVKEQQLRSRETGLKQNGTWLDALRNSYMYNTDPDEILAYEEMIKSLSAEVIRENAKKHFDFDNTAVFVLYPEGMKNE